MNACDPVHFARMGTQLLVGTVVRTFGEKVQIGPPTEELKQAQEPVMRKIWDNQDDEVWNAV